MAEPSKNECLRCGRQFARLEHLQRHIRSHTKEKPFSCTACPKTFTRKDLLKRHTRIYHDQDSSTGTGKEKPPQVSGPNIERLLPQVPDSSDGKNMPYGSLSTHVMGSNDFNLSLDGLTSLHTAQNFNEAGNWISGLEYTDFAPSYAGDEFSEFIDATGFPSNPFDPSYQPVPDWPSEASFPSSAPQIYQDETDTTAEDVETEDTPWASPIQPQGQSRKGYRGIRRVASNEVAKVTHECREIMMEKLKAYSSIIAPDFKLPSRHTLTCFVTGYVTIFNEHYPLIHSPTMRLESLSIELFLSIAAMGAQYYWERTKGLELFHVARAIVYERLRGTAQSGNEPKMKEYDVLQMAQALLLLIAVSTWSQAGKGEAFALRSLLEEFLRSHTLDFKSPVRGDSWVQWKQYEETKRTKLITYCFFNIQTITFDVPPMMLYRDLDTSLACSERLWWAQTAEEWQELRADEIPEVSFSDAFQALFGPSREHTKRHDEPSPLSGHILLQAIIQHIWLSQQAGNLPIRHSLASTEVANAVELALKRWRQRWETDPEPCGPASSSDGPLPFTSRALLRLAYIRINIDSGSSRSIETWNPQKIAVSLHQHPSVERNDKMTKAALHSAQGLGIPIKLGLNLVAHMHVFYWSNQYALASLECALLLTKWLQAVLTPNLTPLSEEEKKLLDFVVQLVNHTEYEAPRGKLLQDNRHLSIIILRLWAKLFRPDSVWEIVDLIGRSLLEYASLLEEELG